MKQKIDEAKTVIEHCIGEKGIWAGSGRYRDQCWTRDFTFSLPTLLDLGYNKQISCHLHELAKRQKRDGQIPILYLDDVQQWLERKIKKSMETGKESFMLKNFFTIEQLTPWTKDSEIFFLIAAQTFAPKGYIPEIDFAHEYIENLLDDEQMFVTGGDWRDTMASLDDKTLLTNNCLLYRAYKLSGKECNASELKKRINKDYWAGGYYRDFLGTNEFDLLGQSLAVLYEIVPEKRYSLIIEKMKEVECSFGYKINTCTPKPVNKTEAETITKTNQYGVIWPFIMGFGIQALDKMGQKEKAEELFAKWDKLDGFNEWYDPETGQGHGDKEQLWSACLYLQTAKALGKTVIGS
ncbi:hypothetical protein HY639_06105 [Candidatus Woesearchaeota archaeon]|nr:hypothetical protein [Candidatus Woesearchaeota archaeon]